MKKRVLMGLILTLGIFLLTACEKNFEKSSCAAFILEEKGISATSLTRLGKIEKAYTEYEFTSGITESDVENYMLEELEKYAEILWDESKTTVETGDVVELSLAFYNGDELLERKSLQQLVVGTGYYEFSVIEEALVGKSSSESFTVMIPAEDVGYSANYGDLSVEVTINHIGAYETKELNDETVFCLYGYENVEAYRAACLSQLERSEYRQFEEQKEQEALRGLCDLCRFKIDENEIADYALNYVSQYEQLAYIYGMDLEQYYCDALKCSDEDAFFAYCYTEALYDIETILAVDAAYAGLDQSITDTMLQEYAETNGMTLETLQEDETLLNYAYYNLERAAVLEKIMNIRETDEASESGAAESNEVKASDEVVNLVRSGYEAAKTNEVTDPSYAGFISHVSDFENYTGYSLDDGEALIIRYTGDCELMESWADARGMNALIRFEEMDYSYAELQAIALEVVNFLNEHSTENSEGVYGIASVNVSESYGRVEIGLIDPSRESVERFKELISDKENAFVFLRGYYATNL